LEIDNKALTGQAAPSLSNRLARASAFQTGNARGHALVPATMRMAAPS